MLPGGKSGGTTAPVAGKSTSSEGGGAKKRKFGSLFKSGDGTQLLSAASVTSSGRARKLTARMQSQLVGVEASTATEERCVPFLFFWLSTDGWPGHQNEDAVDREMYIMSLK